VNLIERSEINAGAKRFSARAPHWRESPGLLFIAVVRPTEVRAPIVAIGHRRDIYRRR
jgi:hypothetical protein